VARYPLSQLLTVFQKVCDAVAFAHSRRIIHRDLKPENVMLGAFGEVLVMDWGLAKVLPRATVQDERTAPLSPASAFAPAQAALTLQGQVMGTPRFMAPEQADGRIDDIDARTDIFALGCMLYNILTLRPPLGDLPVTEVFERLQKGEIPPPAHFNHSAASRNDGAPAKPGIRLVHCPGGRIPGFLSDLTMKAMAVERERRYQSVEELQRDIVAYQQGVAAENEPGGLCAWLARVFHRRKPV
jgi:eukaryotic-like serine/threonine-protein kinase